MWVKHSNSEKFFTPPCIQSVTHLLNKWLIQLMALHSFTFLWSRTGAWPQYVSIQVTMCPSEPASPHLRSLFQRQCQPMDDRWEACAVFFHRRFSLRAPGWMMDLFNCSAIPSGPCGEDKGSAVNCNDSRALPTLVFFSPPLKGHGLQRKPEDPLCPDEKNSILSAAHTLSLRGPRPTHVLVSQGHEAQGAEPRGSPASIFLGPCPPNASPH